MAAKVPKSYRLPAELVEGVRAAAEARGVDQTAWVEEALTRALTPTAETRLLADIGRVAGLGDQGSVARNGPPLGMQAPGGEARVDLAQLASERTGLPLAVCRAKIRGRALTVDGEVWIDPLIRVAKLNAATVVFDGDVLVPAGAATE